MYNPEDIISRKLFIWGHEIEWRFLKILSGNEKEDLKKSRKLGMNCHVGKITNVYFGEPYAQTTNYESVLKNSKL
jgi:hypothetical protein